MWASSKAQFFSTIGGKGCAAEFSVKWLVKEEIILSSVIRREKYVFQRFWEIFLLYTLYYKRFAATVSSERFLSDYWIYIWIEIVCECSDFCRIQITDDFHEWEEMITMSRNILKPGIILGSRKQWFVFGIFLFMGGMWEESFNTCLNYFCDFLADNWRVSG